MAASIGFCWQTWGFGEGWGGDLHTGFKVFSWSEVSITQALLLLLLLAAVSKTGWNTAFLSPWDIVYRLRMCPGGLRGTLKMPVHTIEAIAYLMCTLSVWSVGVVLWREAVRGCVSCSLWPLVIPLVFLRVFKGVFSFFSSLVFYFEGGLFVVFFHFLSLLSLVLFSHHH